MATRKRRDGRSGDLSSHTKAQHLKYCRAIFGAAVEWEYLDRDPFRPDKAVGSPTLRIKGKSRPWHHITPDEFLQLLAVVPTGRRRAAYWLMYGCGLRPGEVYNLRTASIDLGRRRVHVENRAPAEDIPPFNVKAEGQSSDSKERTVPIPAVAVADLTMAIKEAFKASGFVTISPERFAVVRRNWRLCRAGEGWAGHAHRPWQNRDMMNNFLRDTKRYMRQAGIELTAPLTLQTFRKSFAQNHADAGTPPRTLAKLLGHSDVRVTMTFYNRVTDANERAAASTVDRLLTTMKAASRGRGAV